jgi:hypothetical protein
MPRFLRGLVLAAALVPAGCGIGGGDSSEVAKPAKISKAQLAAMVLPQGELGTIAARLTFDERSGPVENAQAAEDTIDPDDTARSVRSAGRLAGHKAWFGDSSLASVRKGRGVFFVGTEIELLEDPVYAAQYLHKQLDDFQRFQGRQDSGTTLTRVRPFPVTRVGDEGEGFRATATAGKDVLYITAVLFRRTRVMGAAIVVRADKQDARREAHALAAKLDERIQGVLAGEIEPETRTPPPETTKTAVRGRSKLPNLTLTAADVGAEPIMESRSEGDGYVAFDRTFEDVFAKDAHLIRLHAQTQLYPTAARAAVAHRVVTSPAGRRAYARIVLDNFEQELGAKPADVQITMVSNLGTGVEGVDVIFTAGGTPFRFTTGFTRSGRAIQAVTGFCRAFAFHPSDLGPLAQRARKRLATIA